MKYVCSFSLIIGVKQLEPITAEEDTCIGKKGLLGT